MTTRWITSREEVPQRGDDESHRDPGRRPERRAWLVTTLVVTRSHPDRLLPWLSRARRE